jgi:L-lysine exporter family protein LysE/ArgO
VAVQFFLEGFLLGLGAAMPIGPVNIVIMNEALRHYPRAVAIGLGAMGADMFYLSAAVLGLAPFLQTPWVQTLLGSAGTLFLLVLGVMLFRHRRDEPECELTGSGPLLGAYIKGLMLTLTNPYTVGFWLSVTAVGVGGSLPWLTAGLVSAILLWIIVMPWIVRRHRNRLGSAVRRRVNTVAAAILLLFALLLLVRTLA